MVPRSRFTFKARDKKLALGRRTRIMGVVNVTPDSFFDGGRFLDRDAAVLHALHLVQEGADILDVGGESSRPGAEPVPAEVELQRVIPVIEAIRRQVDTLISVDTYKAVVAEAALQAGAEIINDISAFRLDSNMPALVSRWRAGVALMHMKGNPRNMQQLPPSHDLLGDIRADLQRALGIASMYQIPSDRILIDPGIGFGKTAEDNLVILNRLSFLEDFQLPVLVGTSRKSFLGNISGAPAEGRQWATAATVAVAILRGAQVVRVHDVFSMRQVADVADAILAEKLST